MSVYSSIGQWCCFVRSFAHPLLTCGLFSNLQCPIGGSTAASHNADSLLWFFLLSSNKLDVLVYCWLRFSDLSYQGRTVFYSVIVRFAIVTCGGGALIVPSIMSYNSTVVTSDWSATMAKASKSSSSSESSSMADISRIMLWSCC